LLRAATFRGRTYLPSPSVPFAVLFGGDILAFADAAHSRSVVFSPRRVCCGFTLLSSALC
jgi:hypothetical protein